MRDDYDAWAIFSAPIHVVESYDARRRRFWRKVWWTLAVLVVVCGGLWGLNP